MKTFTTRQILNQKLYNASDFEEKCFFLKSMVLKKKNVFKKHVFEEKVAHKKSRFDSIYPVKCAKFAFTCYFKKHELKKELFQKAWFWTKTFL